MGTEDQYQRDRAEEHGFDREEELKRIQGRAARVADFALGVLIGILLVAFLTLYSHRH